MGARAMFELTGIFPNINIGIQGSFLGRIHIDQSEHY
jgi:uncharacterized membrane protein YeaQ/YmgE (transglycosylase-associated protein family)